MNFTSLLSSLFVTASLFAINCGYASGQELEKPSNNSAPFEIKLVDRENGWPVPLVELRTTHHVRFISDNAGRVAIDAPELMERKTAFIVVADGYEAQADGFGQRLIRTTPRAGESITFELDRTGIAKRLGRLTGGGLFAESQKLGLERDWPESGIAGCDSIQSTVHNGKLFWSWGDTSIFSYPLGLFHMTGATTSQTPLQSFEPPIRLRLNYFTDDSDAPRTIAKMQGDGPTWLSGFASLPDQTGKNRLVASYIKIKPPMEGYESGLCVWNDSEERFDHLKTVWKKSEELKTEPPIPRGHTVTIDVEDGKKVVLFGDPFPALRCPATFEAWQDDSQWEVLTPQAEVQAADDSEVVKPHSGSIAWNEHRKRWVCVFMQSLGKPSAFGELWYTEADSPYGPWGPAVKVLSHANYTFYNPRLHAELNPEQPAILLFEGTYTHTFANNAIPTPRYDYNQVLYRLDLDDPKLKPAQVK